mmetsp:Transcript_21553/g.46857  ORF Transcript_21553/g.46857 Transcript_21553/m.46857 type:complete len:679 (+) Transcript_21553:132-2168(+)|eukprot:CAMPEP_0206443572 /NCGR_PEP_ID=MMETSP0324_2-20121206/14439_1 /ASSEMBLY_ACC=CAM_ASM_000836 /TAXON_ID=2866 /ORGANISM="Crypthecodinium cohnii, Strain Seligo" /LENGTH=678 /DNA_ID=CAMNT_0053911515 /DNA_START=88 /DNA_END=2124 /DNA_ORIENTATION=+
MQVDFGDEEDAHIVPRREHNTFAPIRHETLHCYGVDFLSNKEVLDLFHNYNPKEVEWLDDSSCNVVFPDETTAKSVLEGLHNKQPLDKEVWYKTIPLTPKATNPSSSSSSAAPKARKAPLKAISLQLRLASEADRKDPGHSGHTDSVYYAHVKEKQALQKQQAELRRLKKRQRMSRLPQMQQKEEKAPNNKTDEGKPDESMGMEGTGGAAIPNATAETPGTGELQLRLGMRGIMDPLLFMRASNSLKSNNDNNDTTMGNSSSSTAGQAGVGEQPLEDLADVLRKAEAEYALPTATGDAEVAGRPRGKGDGKNKGKGKRSSSTRPKGTGRGDGETRGRDSTKGRGKRGKSRQPSTSRKPSDGEDIMSKQDSEQQQQQQQRGKKRRPTEQEPRPVSEAAPPQRAVRALKEVEEFLATHRVRCQRHRLARSFRSIVYGQQKKNKAPENGDVNVNIEGKDNMSDRGSEASAKQQPKGEKEPPPWEQYQKVNGKFTKSGHFLHSVAWDAHGRTVLTVVPFGYKVNVERVAKCLKEPQVRLKKLQELSKQTGWPVFVCPPFGHPKDKSGREPVLLVDSAVTEFKKPLLFDCGTVGLSMPVSEFLRSTSASCVEGLAIPLQEGEAARPIKTSAPHTEASTPEPAPEPAPVSASPANFAGRNEAEETTASAFVAGAANGGPVAMDD